MTAEVAELGKPDGVSDAAANKTVTSGAATVKKARIIKKPLVHQDPTISLKTWTGDLE